MRCFLPALVVVPTLASAATTVPEEPPVRDLGPFTMRLPAAFRDQKIHGCDSRVGEYRSSTATLDFDFGLYSGEVTGMADSPGARQAKVPVDGHTAVLVRVPPQHDTAQQRWEVGLELATGREAFGFKEGLAIWASTTTEAEADRLVELLKTLRLKPEEPAKEPASDTPARKASDGEKP